MNEVLVENVINQTNYLYVKKQSELGDSVCDKINLYSILKHKDIMMNIKRKAETSDTHTVIFLLACLMLNLKLRVKETRQFWKKLSDIAKKNACMMWFFR